MEELLLQLSGNSHWVIYGIAFGVLIACGFGAPIPEDVVLFSLGYFSYRGDASFAGSLAVSFLGVLGGDTAIYWLGRRWGNRILTFRFFRRIFKPSRLAKVRDAFHRNGNVYLFFARFAPGLRAVTFWSAGLFRIPFRTFFLLDGAAALLSIPAFVYVGYFLGEAFHERIGDVREAIFWLGLVAVGVIVFVTWRHLRRRRQQPEQDRYPGEREG